VTFNLSQDRGQLRGLVSDGTKPKPFQSGAIKTAPALAMEAAQLSPASD
jgi:hypothetical protein